jgi:hypothetical protein
VAPKRDLKPTAFASNGNNLQQASHHRESFDQPNLLVHLLAHSQMQIVGIVLLPTRRHPVLHACSWLTAINQPSAPSNKVVETKFGMSWY